ncbi:MAG: hypothetical protein R3E01_19445 [Pirellulaceae bacterium]|nr:hypothetical protein [Planctomycetales bacterium]
MQFSLRSILFVMLLVAMAALLHARRQRNLQMAVESDRLRRLIDQIQAEVDLAISKQKTCEQMIDAAIVPSATFTHAQDRFQTLSSRYGDVNDDERDMPRIKMVPTVSDDAFDRRHIRLHIPADPNESYQIRLAVFRCQMFRNPQLPPLTDDKAKEILNASPFHPTTATYISLKPGRYDVVTTWIGGEQPEFTLNVDGTDRVVMEYTRALSKDVKYGAMGSWVEDGWLRPDRNELLIRSVSPIDEGTSQFAEYTLSCELIRTSAPLHN